MIFANKKFDYWGIGSHTRREIRKNYKSISNQKMVLDFYFLSFFVANSNHENTKKSNPWYLTLM